MKGLMIKDAQLMLINKKSVPIFIIIAAMILFTGNSDMIYFVISYFTMLCGMMALGTISYDELEHSGAFLMTMPISRKTYAIEKYIFTFLGVMAGWAVSFLCVVLFLFARKEPINLIELLISSLSIVLALYLMFCIMLPIQLKYGNQRSRIVLLVFAAIVMLAVTGANFFVKTIKIDMTGVMQDINQFLNGIGKSTAIAILVVGGIAVFLICIAISMRISMGIMKKKEY